MKQMRIFGAAFVAVALTACEPTLDVESVQSMHASAEAMMNSLSGAEREKLDRAATIVMWDGLGRRAAEQVKLAHWAPYDGYTVEDILRKAQEIENARWQERAAEANRMLEDFKTSLTTLRENFEAEKKRVQDFRSKVEIQGVLRFEEPSGWTTEKSRVVDFIYRNGLDQPLLRVDYEVSAYSKGRSVPWYMDTQMHEFPAGIEPGETLSKTYEMGRGWRDVPEDRNDLVLQFKLLEAFGVNGNRLISDTTSRIEYEIATLEEKISSQKERIADLNDANPAGEFIAAR